MYDIKAYSYVREVFYEGIKYNVVEALKHDLLLVVPFEDFQNKKFPLIPTVIPDLEQITGRGNM